MLHATEDIYLQEIGKKTKTSAIVERLKIHLSFKDYKDKNLQSVFFKYQAYILSYH